MDFFGNKPNEIFPEPFQSTMESIDHLQKDTRPVERIKTVLSLPNNFMIDFFFLPPTVAEKVLRRVFGGQDVQA